MKHSLIVTPSPNLEKSLDFYRRLQFFEFGLNGKQYMADGDYILELESSKFARAGVKLYKASWESEVNELRKITEVVKVEEGYICSDFTGTRIYLIENDQGVEVPVKLERKSLLGNIAGLSLEGISIAPMYKLWKILGFKKTMGDENSGWMSMENEDGLGISLMGANTCPHMFYNPSLTYFNGPQNLDIIENIRKMEIPITEEITHFNKEGIVDNIIIRDPGGLGFFLFSD